MYTSPKADVAECVAILRIAGVSGSRQSSVAQGEKDSSSDTAALINVDCTRTDHLTTCLPFSSRFQLHHNADNRRVPSTAELCAQLAKQRRTTDLLFFRLNHNQAPVITSVSVACLSSESHQSTPQCFQYTFTSSDSRISRRPLLISGNNERPLLCYCRRRAPAAIHVRQVVLARLQSPLMFMSVLNYLARLRICGSMVRYQSNANQQTRQPEVDAPQLCIPRGSINTLLTLLTDRGK